MGITATDISQRIIDAVLAQKLAPGTRLGEQQLALLFDCSRTIVREALTRLAARGIVTVSARRGWYLIAPSRDEAREAFEARRVIELGLLRGRRPLDKPALTRLKKHLAQEKAALRGDDVGARSFLLGDFHVCLAECLGNSLLADTLRDYTARTTLIAMLYQSSHDAAQSCQEHVAIVAALEQGDAVRAEALMAEHLASVQAGLQLETQTDDPLHQLRQALTPLASSATTAASSTTSSPPSSTASSPAVPARRARARRVPTDAADSAPAPYLGALL
jgi:DNA-binding GntR family transcriptional regulator